MTGNRHDDDDGMNLLETFLWLLVMIVPFLMLLISAKFLT